MDRADVVVGTRFGELETEGVTREERCRTDQAGAGEAARIRGASFVAVGREGAGVARGLVGRLEGHRVRFVRTAVLPRDRLADLDADRGGVVALDRGDAV